MKGEKMITQTAAVKTNRSSIATTRMIAFCGMFAAIAAVLMFFEIPLPFAPIFYKLDFSEVPVLIGTFCFGPVAGAVIEALKILLKFAIKGTSTAGVGELANFAVGCAFVVPAGIVYKMMKSKKGALIGCITGTLVMAVLGCFINAYILLPFYANAFEMPIEALIGMGTAVNPAINSLLTFVVLAVAPFNIVKGVLVSIITFLLYKRISQLVKGANR